MAWNQPEWNKKPGMADVLRTAPDIHAHVLRRKFVGGDGAMSDMPRKSRALKGGGGGRAHSHSCALAVRKLPPRLLLAWDEAFSSRPY